MKCKLKKLILISIFLAAILSISAVAAEDNSTKSFGEIQMQIDSAGEGDTIELDGTYINTHGQVYVDKKLTIKGVTENTTLDANHLGGVMDISHPHTTLINLKFTNSNYGAVECEYNTTFINCTFINNNNAGEFGGGAVNFKHSANFINCIFINNTAKRGGAIFSQYNDDGKVTTTSIEKCVFTNNSATLEGGAVYTDIYQNGKLKSVSVADSKFIANLAGRGGAIFSHNLDLKNCIFEKNNAKPIKTEEELMEGSSSAVYVHGKNFKSQNCSFTDNRAHFMATIELNTDINTFTDTKFINNTAEYFACYISLNSKDSLSKCSLINNSAKYIGGIGTVSGEIKITDPTFKNNINGAVSNVEGKTIVVKDGKSKTYSIGVYNDLMKSSPIIKAVVQTEFVSQVNKRLNIEVKLVDAKTNQPLKNLHVNVKVYQNNKLIDDDDHRKTNSKGIATFPFLQYSKLGTYKLVFDHSNEGYPLLLPIKKTTTTVKIVKGKPATVNAPPVTNKLKKSQYFKATVKIGKTPLKNTYVKLKIDKTTYKLKTSSSGIVKFNTKSLKVGKHDVSITSGNSNYYMSAKSSITIKR